MYFFVFTFFLAFWPRGLDPLCSIMLLQHAIGFAFIVFFIYLVIIWNRHLYRNLVFCVIISKFRSLEPASEIRNAHCVLCWEKPYNCFCPDLISFVRPYIINCFVFLLNSKATQCSDLNNKVVFTAFSTQHSRCFSLKYFLLHLCIRNTFYSSRNKTCMLSAIIISFLVILIFILLLWYSILCNFNSFNPISLGGYFII